MDRKIEKYKVPAIVLGMSVNGLGVVRSLGKEGVKAFALDSEASKPYMHTRYATPLICPDAQKEPERLKVFLLDLARKNGGTAVVFPTSDIFNAFVHRYRDELIPELLFSIPLTTLMNKLLDKKGQYDLARKFDVPTPMTFLRWLFCLF